MICELEVFGFDLDGIFKDGMNVVKEGEKMIMWWFGLMRLRLYGVLVEGWFLIYKNVFFFYWRYSWVWVMGGSKFKDVFLGRLCYVV